MGKLTGHTALVTGSTRGTGKAIALRFARDGASIGVVGLRSRGEEVVDQIQALGARALFVQADISHSMEVERMVEEISGVLGTVDILVNNAAITDYEYSSAWEVREEMWDRICEVNLKGTFLCCRAVLPPMLGQGWGRIVNISSTSGINGGTSGVHYAASKGGVIALSKALAREVAGHGVTVNVVAPSKIDTDMFRMAAPGAKREETISRIPVGRLGQPEDIAEAVAYFAGEDAAYTTGQVLVVSGGY
ncbi:MAG: 3-oxoacyl-ACP reductase FabG [Spirochaetes bacterium]|nr:3-oxoacyl-ACP reductase FabG [Spirochaetota bacterium]